MSRMIASRSILTALTVALTVTLASGEAFSEETPVDLELILAADVSDSMDRTLGRLQRRGYAAALRSPGFSRAVASGAERRIALTYFEWGDSGRIEIIVPWTLIERPSDATAVASVLETRRVSRFAKTSISHALQFGLRLFDDNGFSSARRVIDISGNGPNNQGNAIEPARDAAVAAGVTINGLPILLNLDQPRGPFATGFDRRNLDRYYAECVIGGVGAFVQPVRDLEDFARAIRRKLITEVSGRPVVALPVQFDPLAPWPPQSSAC
ncbi:MAG: DUF1194 domain-containing protein [Pseudomonadota bacterium]